jgi:hypothetical protein
MKNNSIVAHETPERRRAIVDQLRALRPLIARRGTRDQKIAFNATMQAAKGRRFDTSDSKYGYGPRAKLAVAAAQFEAMAKQYHRKNPAEVRLSPPRDLL